MQMGRNTAISTVDLLFKHIWLLDVISFHVSGLHCDVLLSAFETAVPTPWLQNADAGAL